MSESTSETTDDLKITRQQAADAIWKMVRAQAEKHGLTVIFAAEFYDAEKEQPMLIQCSHGDAITVVAITARMYGAAREKVDHALDLHVKRGHEIARDAKKRAAK